MTNYVALLRAVNVGGTGKLPMSDLQKICHDANFTHVQTYIASGNVVFQSAMSSKLVKAELEARLLTLMGKHVGIVVRTACEMQDILNGNPFPKAAPNRTVVIFLDEPPSLDALEFATGIQNEEMLLRGSEIYIHYGDGMRDSKLKIPAAKNGTARNLNTVAKLTDMVNNI